MIVRLLPSLATFAIALGLWMARDTWIDWAVGAQPQHIEAIAWTSRATLGLLIIAGAWLIRNVCEHLLWPALERKGGSAIPRLLKNGVSALIALLAIAALLIAVFGQSPLNILLLLLGVFVVLFLFFREPLSDLVAGISINLEGALAIGDTIETADGRAGRLEEITWRSTHLRGTDGSLLIIPNAEFSRSTLLNRSADAGRLQTEVRFILDFGLDPGRALRVLKGALHSAAGVGGILKRPEPRIGLWQAAEYGNEYRVIVSYDPHKTDELAVRTEIGVQVMSHFRNTGLAPTLPKQNIFVGEFRSLQQDWFNVEHRETLLASFDIFAPLEPAEIAQLSRDIKVRSYGKDETILHQGDTDTSMFGLVEGFLDVTVDFEEGKTLHVGRVVPGEFFGELPLLFGDPRSATVSAGVDSMVFEITRENFSKILEKRPEIAEHISRVIAERQIANNQAMASERDREQALEATTNSLVDRMRQIFGSLVR